MKALKLLIKTLVVQANHDLILYWSGKQVYETAIQM